jgi:hypothetical protein
MRRVLARVGRAGNPRLAAAGVRRTAPAATITTAVAAAMTAVAAPVAAACLLRRRRRVLRAAAAARALGVVAVVVGAGVVVGAAVGAATGRRLQPRHGPQRLLNAIRLRILLLQRRLAQRRPRGLGRVAVRRRRNPAAAGGVVPLEVQALLVLVLVRLHHVQLHHARGVQPPQPLGLLQQPREVRHLRAQRDHLGWWAPVGWGMSVHCVL